MRIRPLRKLAFVAGLVALATVSTPVMAKAGDIYSAGHADLNISYDSTTNSLGMNYEFGTNAVINGVILGPGGAGERAADSITVFLGANSLGVASASLPSPFAGQPIWIAPQTSRANRPFLGIGAETIEPGIFQDDTVILSLTGLTVSPAGGNFVLWQNGNEANPFFNSADGFSALDRLEVAGGGHDHFNWGFNKEGLYRLQFSASGKLLNGTTVTTSAVYEFQIGSLTVVPEPGSLTLAGVGLGCAGLFAYRRRKHALSDASAHLEKSLRL